MRAFPLLFVFLATGAMGAPTSLELNPDDSGAAYTADYSQAVIVRARLTGPFGEPLAGERVTFSLERGDDNSTAFVFDDPVTDAQGYATARLTLVDGRHGGQTFTAEAATMDVPGERYVIRARFQGDPFAEGCDSDGGPLPDAGFDDDLCEANDDNELFVALETATLVIQPGIEVELGGTVPIVATLSDLNGDAEQAGTDVDGSGPKALAGRRVGFFYDVNGNGRAENAERVPCENTGESFAETNAEGVATCDFFADPSYVDTVNVDQGIHAQFGGDDQYGLAGAAQAITVAAAAPDPARTLLEVSPETAPADGFSIVEIRAILVDAANNVLGVDDPAYDVSFETDLGTLEGEATRDPITGRYLGALKAPRAGGDATVRVLVDGAPGTTATVSFEQQGCTCAAGSVGDGAMVALLLIILSGRRARHRRRKNA